MRSCCIPRSAIVPIVTFIVDVRPRKRNTHAGQGVGAKFKRLGKRCWKGPTTRRLGGRGRKFVWMQVGLEIGKHVAGR